MLDAHQRARFARHLLLAEIGERGQERLSAARRAVPPTADGDAARTARDYLVRAGVEVLDDAAAAQAVDVPSPARVEALAGRPELRDAAAALAGAFVAVEAIKQVTGVGQAASLPADMCLLRGDA